MNSTNYNATTPGEPTEETVREASITFQDKVKALPKKVWIAAGAVLIALIAVILLVSTSGNTYKTPIELEEWQDNQKTYMFSGDVTRKLANGYADAEAKEIVNILKKSNAYDDDKADFENLLQRKISNYGSEFKHEYKIKDKEKLDDDDLEHEEESKRDWADSTYTRLYKALDRNDSYYWEEVSDRRGISEAEAIALAKACLNLANKMRYVDISEGYELTVSRTTTGSEMVLPREELLTYTVYKVDGIWMDSGTLYDLWVLSAKG